MISEEDIQKIADPDTRKKVIDLLLESCKDKGKYLELAQRYNDLVSLYDNLSKLHDDTMENQQLFVGISNAAIEQESREFVSLKIRAKKIATTKALNLAERDQVIIDAAKRKPEAWTTAQRARHIHDNWEAVIGYEHKRLSIDRIRKILSKGT